MVLAKFAFVALTLCFLAWHSEAFGMKPRQTTPAKLQETQTTSRPQNNFYLELESRCKDRFPRCTLKRCRRYRYGFMKRRMQKYCRKTCGYCRAYSPPSCYESLYGCCWDYSTAALGPNGKGCPPCEDSKRYPYVCRRFKSYCLRLGISGKWMRTKCPNSCGHCAIWQF